MAITASTRTEIIQLVVAMFNGAPGASVLSELVTSLGNGTVKQLAANLEKLAVFNGIYPTFLTDQEFADRFLNNLVGTDVSSADKASFATTLVAKLAAGASRSSVIIDSISKLNSTASTDTAWINGAAVFNNKVTVATYYTVEKQLSASTLGELQNVIVNVTSATASVNTAKSSVDSTGSVGLPFTLTTGVDTFAGTEKNDAIAATHLTLTGNDAIRGGAGNDTLSIVDTGATPFALNGSIVFDSIETVKIQNMNGGGLTGTAGVTESAVVTLPALANGKTLIINGLTLTAGADLPAATVAAAFLKAATLTTGDLDSFGQAHVNATSAVISGTATTTTVTNGAYNAAGVATKIWAASAGPATDKLIFTSAVTNSNVLDLAVTGTGGTSIAKVSTYVMSGTPTTLSYLSFSLNGSPVGTSILATDNAAGAGAAFAAAINQAVGSTVAVDTAGSVAVTGNYTIGAITTVVAATGVLSGAQTLVARSVTTNAYTGAAATVTVNQGVAESALASTQGGVDSLTASRFVGTTSFVNDASTSGLKITGLASTQVPTIQSNGAVTIGSNEYGYSSVASPVLNIQGGGTSGALTLTGTSTTAATINVKDAPKTSTGTTGSTTVGVSTLFNDATSTTSTLTINTTDSNFTTGALTTKAGSIVLTGNGAVSFGTTAVTDANLTAVNGAGLTVGGITFVSPTAANATAFTAFTGGAGSDTFTTNGPANLLSVIDAAAGTGDRLILTANTDMDSTIEAAYYKNFEILRTAAHSGTTYDATLLPGLTSIELIGTAAATSGITGLKATQAEAITVYNSGNAGSTVTFALADSGGTADVASIKLGSSAIGTTTTGGAANITTALGVNGFETVNLTAVPGATAAVGGALQKSAVAAFTADVATAINLKGTSFTLANIATTKAVTIDGSALTGDKAVLTTNIVGFTAAGTAFNGSKIIGSNFNDTFTITAEGSTYNGGAGDDTFTVAVAALVADGTNDLVINGGTDSGVIANNRDTLAISDVGVTLTDNHFTFVSGIERLTTSTGSVSITTGAGFNAAFVSDVTIATGVLADASTFLYAGGLSSRNATVTVDGTALVANAAAEDVTITTGGGNDKVTLTGTTWVGAAGADSGTITISTAAGDDTISYSHGTLLATTTSQNAVITAGAGADVIVKVGTNSTTVTSVSNFVMAAGDSAVGARDKITGFDVSDGTNLSDLLNFEGTATISTLAASNDFGIIRSHAITAGVATFDDAESFVEPLVINASRLADVLGYLAANTAANGTVAFAYDSDSSGTADATMVFHKGSTVTTSNDLIELVGITGVDALITTNTAGANDLFIG